MMTNPKTKSGQNKSNVKVNNDGIESTKPASAQPANGDIRAAIIEIIENDDTVIQSIIDTVSDRRRRVGWGMEPPGGERPPPGLVFHYSDHLSSVCYGGKQYCHLAIITSKLTITQQNGE